MRREVKNQLKDMFHEANIEKRCRIYNLADWLYFEELVSELADDVYYIEQSGSRVYVLIQELMRDKIAISENIKLALRKNDIDTVQYFNNIEQLNHIFLEICAVSEYSFQYNYKKPHAQKQQDQDQEDEEAYLLTKIDLAEEEQ